MGINRDANRLAQEIGATQFSLMLSDNPKALDGTHPIINEKLSNSWAKVLSIFGGADPYSGNVFKKGIAPMVRRIPNLGISTTNTSSHLKEEGRQGIRNQEVRHYASKGYDC